jgi:hypothetical protein
MPGDWTLKLRAKQAIAKAPSSMRRWLRFGKGDRPA